LALLQNPNVLKAGVKVSSDLSMLAKECNQTSTFPGAVELTSLAKEKLFIRKAQASLSDLCAVILKKNLAKNVAERVSNVWSRDELTESQKKYAATDAYACLVIHNAMSSIDIPQLLPAHPELGCPVFIYADPLSNPVAAGRIADASSLSKQSPSSAKTPAVTKTRIVVSVEQVFASGAIVGPYKPPQLLSDFGQPVFSIVCLRSHLRLTSETLLLANPFNLPVTAHNDTVMEVPSAPGGLGINISPPVTTSPDLASDEISVQEILGKSSQHGEFVSATAVSKMATDPVSLQTADDVIEEVSVIQIIRSRVCKDVYHVFAEIYISRTHSLGYTFSIALRDAFFIPDPHDKAQITLYAKKLDPPQTFESLVAARSNWVWERCKRTVPPAEELFKVVSEVFKTFGPLLDAASRKPLFNAQAWKTSKNILQLIRKGHVSDPPGVSLYSPLRTDSNGLTVYRCARGTNFVEGGWHRHIRDKLPKSGVSIRHLTLSLKDFALGHNLRVSNLMFK
jgi:hypothetical protein